MITEKTFTAAEFKEHMIRFVDEFSKRIGEQVHVKPERDPFGRVIGNLVFVNPRSQWMFVHRDGGPIETMRVFG